MTKRPDIHVLKKYKKLLKKKKEVILNKEYLGSWIGLKIKKKNVSS